MGFLLSRLSDNVPLVLFRRLLQVWARLHRFDVSPLSNFIVFVIDTGRWWFTIGFTAPTRFPLSVQGVFSLPFAHDTSVVGALVQRCAPGAIPVFLGRIGSLLGGSTSTKSRRSSDNRVPLSERLVVAATLLGFLSTNESTTCELSESSAIDQ